MSLADTRHVTIGRTRACELCLSWDAGVSRVHAQLDQLGDDQWVLIDDGVSRNGSTVNGKRLRNRRRLADGDIMCFGTTPVLYRAPSQSTTRTVTVQVPTPEVATVLFTDIVDSTAQLSRVGDRSWRDLLDEHNRLVRDELAVWHGNEVNTTGDGFLATFDAPGRAVRCAAAIVGSIGRLGVELRAGLHTGECHLGSADVAGIAVHITARVVERAEPGEVLVSSTVRDLVGGSGLRFSDRGEHALKGIDERWRLYALEP